MEEKRAESLSMSARVSEMARLLRSGGQTDEQLAVVLHDAHECDIAAALELLDVRQRTRLYRLLGVERLVILLQPGIHLFSLSGAALRKGLRLVHPGSAAFALTCGTKQHKYNLPVRRDGAHQFL